MSAQPKKSLRGVLVLALVAIAGIVGMLLTEGTWDRLSFALAALPLAIGAWRGWSQRQAGLRAPAIGRDEALGDEAG